MQNIKRFAANLNGLAEVLGTELSSLKLSFYERALSDFSDEQIEKAITMAARSMKFFPKPSELIELIEGKSEERSILAWDELVTAIQRHGSYASVRFADAKITKTVELMGGWLEVCSITEDETKFRRPEFQKIYSNLRGGFDTKTLPGRYELDNAMRGFTSSIPQPILIGSEKGDVLMLEYANPPGTRSE